MVQIQKQPAFGGAGQDVVTLQSTLKTFGHDVGPVDGQFGTRTLLAVKQFQSEHGLAADGVVGPMTMKALGIELVASRPDGGPYVSITKPLKDRTGRHLHPELRQKIEKWLFPNRTVPSRFIEANIPECVRQVALTLNMIGIREVGGNNMGHDVGLVQSIIGAQTSTGNGDAWCMSTDQCIIAFIEDYFQLPSPVPASEGCLDVLAGAKRVQGLVEIVAEVGSFFIGEHGNKPGRGHTGTVLSISGSMMKTFEGNTGDVNADGPDGAYVKTRGTHYIGGDLTVKGFVRVYPYNLLPKAGAK